MGAWPGGLRGEAGMSVVGMVGVGVLMVGTGFLSGVFGVAGPRVDTFFLGGKLDRRQIVATKSACQVFGHAVKLLYFTGLIDQAAGVDPVMAAVGIGASMLGTSLARKLLEAMSDATFRR